MSKTIKFTILAIFIQSFATLASENLAWLTGKEISLASKNNRAQLKVESNLGERSGVSSYLKSGKYSNYVSIYKKTMPNNISYLVLSYVQTQTIQKEEIEIQFRMKEDNVVEEWGVMYINYFNSLYKITDVHIQIN